MRSLMILFFALAAFGCSPTVVRDSNTAMASSGLTARSNTHDASAAATMEFLLEVAAADFQAHPPGGSRLRFHNVHLGYLASAAGTPRYMLCGTFSSEETGVRAEAIPFVTVDSPGGPNGYQQMLGANSLCADPAAILDNASDLSSSLQSKFDSIVSLDKVISTSSELVEINAKMAIEVCGQGNVKKVSTESYECKLN